MLGPDGARLPSIGVWLWGGSPESSKFTTTASDGTFSFTHGDGSFTLIVYVIENDAYVGWYSEGSPGGFTTQRARATEFRLDGDSLTEVEIRLPSRHVRLPPAMASGTTAAVPVPDAKPAGAMSATPTATPTLTPTPTPSPTPTPTATPTPSPTPSPTPAPTPTPAPIPLYPEIVFVGDVDPTTQADYRASMEEVVAFYSDRYGVEFDFAVYIGADIEAIRGALQDLGISGANTLNVRGTIWNIRGTWALLVAGSFGVAWADARVLAHEYFHILQTVLSDTSRLATPRWLLEGGAVYQSWLYGGRWEGYRPRAIIYSSNCEGELRDFESFETTAIEVACGYPAGAFASEWLARHAGAYSHIRYWELLRTSRTWEDAFTSAFEITPVEFYEAFQEHVEESLSELDAGRVEGVVLGPDGEGLHGIGLTLLGNSVWIAEPNQAGSFGLHVFNGTYTIKLYADVGSRRDVAGATAPRHIGWYGEGGFTTDRDQATVIEVDGDDVTGIEIHLPANPADLPTIE